MNCDDWKPCSCMDGAGQGMVLEEDWFTDGGEPLPLPLPRMRWRCQDCLRHDPPLIEADVLAILHNRAMVGDAPLECLLEQHDAMYREGAVPDSGIPGSRLTIIMCLVVFGLVFARGLIIRACS